MTNKPVAENLKKALADTYALYLKTQNYHWNVEGEHFRSLHLMFEEQYKELAAAIDEIAELIRGLGEKAPGTFEAFQKQTSIKPGDVNANATKMVSDLVQDQELITQTLKKTFDAAQTAGDEVVVDAMIGRMTAHRKNQWMLKSILG